MTEKVRECPKCEGAGGWWEAGGLSFATDNFHTECNECNGSGEICEDEEA